MCDKRREFWRHQDFNRNIRFACDNLFRKIKLVQIFVVTGASTTIFLYILRPCFGNKLILEMWMIRDNVGFNGAVLMLQYYMFTFVVPIVIGYDSLYLAFCIDVGVQVRLLKFKLKQLTRKNVIDAEGELDDCIKHHQFLQV